MIGKNIVVYDCEIENVIDGKVISWDTYDKMGLSVACLYDYLDDDYKVYFREDIPALCERLNSADLVVGFNTTGFDNKLLRALGGDLRPDDSLKNWDILYWSRRAIGWKEGVRFPSGLRLDNHLESIFGDKFKKTGDGALAPVWWQEGKRSQVITYCLADVKRERMLFEHIFNYGWVSTLAHGCREIDRSELFKVAVPTDDTSVNF